MSGVEPKDKTDDEEDSQDLPVLPLSNPITDVLGNVIIYGDKITIEDTEYIIFDPTKQHFRSQVVSRPASE